MIDVEKTLAEYGFTQETYEQFLKDCSDKVEKISEMDWSEICSKYNLELNSDTLRKSQQPQVTGGAFVRSYYLWKNGNANVSSENMNNYSDEIASQLRELERAKIKFRDQRNAWSKQNYIDARTEQSLDLLEEKLLEMSKVNFPTHERPYIDGDREMIICLSDLHIGQCFNGMFGEYNSDIAKERIGRYLNAVKEMAELYNVKKAHIVSLGDQVSGSIHHTIAITNRENVIEQVKLATEIISSFCYECTSIFENVFFYNVVGNHTRLTKKDDALHNERLDDIISWAVGLSLQHIDNFHTMTHRNLDNGIVDVNVCGNSFIGVHGDFDAMNKSGVSSLSFMLGFIPYGILRGHCHYTSFQDINGVKVIQSGSLAGSGDDHTVEMRLTGKATQTICICDSKGIKAHIPVELN